MKASSSTLYKHVPSDGPINARIIILAESPWVSEAETGRPLAGASGNLLKRWWVTPEINLQRGDMRVMNLFPYRPPSREVDSIPREKLIKAIEGVHLRLAKLIDPYVIVTMGNYATYALTGKGKVKANIRSAFSLFDSNATEADKKAGITQLRGSIYPYKDLHGRVIKVIPTIHPAGVLQMAKWEKRSIVDWQRIARESQYKEICDPHRQHLINPTKQQIEEFCQVVYAGMGRYHMSVDIETWGNTLTCVGFAVSPTWSITLPTSGSMKWTLPYVKWLCECEVEKVLCNGMYDWYWTDAEGVPTTEWLSRRGIQLNNYWRDVQSMHHALDPAENHSLDFLASIFCPYYVYWKDEAKEAEEIIKYAKDLDALYVYNGLDVCYTHELDGILEARLRQEGMWDFYLQHYAAMFEPLLRTMRHGIRVNVERQKEEAKILRGELKELHAKLNALAGCELFAVEEKTALRNPNAEEWMELLGDKLGECVEFPPKGKMVSKEGRSKLQTQGLVYMIGGKSAGKIRYKVSRTRKDFSNDKLLEFFYTALGLPKQFVMRKRKAGKAKSVSLDEATVRKLMFKYAKAVEPGKLLLEYREKKKELDYMKGAWDVDGRIRCSYKMNTRAGRLSSSSNPMRKGYNLQNLKRG